MFIAESTVTKLHIKNAPALDPITVFLEDHEPGCGSLTITCYGKAWTAYWGGMGGKTIAEFLCGCDAPYIANKVQDRVLSRADFKYLHRVVAAVHEAIKDRARLQAQEPPVCHCGMLMSDHHEGSSCTTPREMER